MSDVANLERELRAWVAADRLEDVAAHLQPMLASGTGPIPLWRILVFVLRQLGHHAQALPVQQMLVENFPGDLTARFDLSEILLLLGQFDAGWRAYRYRYSMPHTTRIERKVQAPRWEGERMTGRTLLVHDEQGYGDTFQFIRLVPAAKQRSQANLILDINNDCHSLVRRAVEAGILAGPDTVVPSSDLPPPFAAHCELLSLPLALGLQLTDLPGSIPYLVPDPAHVEKWRARLANLPRPLVALTWAGRPTHPNDANRSLTLEMLTPLAATGVQFVAIQKGPSAEQAKTPPGNLRIESLSDEIADFEDTAAILMICDLLLSVDSSPVHLAGALGRPAWVMLPFLPDWRWLTDRTDTPWYPTTHRLFRQPRRKAWDPVVADVTGALGVFRQG
jgi:hypothetical protein